MRGEGEEGSQCRHDKMSFTVLIVSPSNTEIFRASKHERFRSCLPHQQPC